MAHLNSTFMGEEMSRKSAPWAKAQSKSRRHLPFLKRISGLGFGASGLIMAQDLGSRVEGPESLIAACTYTFVALQ